jgi:hypothetical protein
MFKTFFNLTEYCIPCRSRVHFSKLFRILNFGHSYLLSADASLRAEFRYSDFGFVYSLGAKPLELSTQAARATMSVGSLR